MTNGVTKEEMPLSISEMVSDNASIDSFPSDFGEDFGQVGEKISELLSFSPRALFIFALFFST